MVLLQIKQWMTQIDSKPEEANDDVIPAELCTRNIDEVVLGQHLIRTWYFSPYPDEYGELERLYVCQQCFRYIKSPQVYVAHRQSCDLDCPPGHLIYDHNGIKIYEVDPKEHKLYCQNLCLFTKLFLEEKTLFYDIESFFFYVLVCAQFEDGKLVERTVGYFSKEKTSLDENNLATVLIFPPYQGKGYGRFMIEFSKTGHPERPLSDLGRRGYMSYWTWAILSDLAYAFANKSDDVLRFSIGDISKRTGIDVDDCIETLSGIGFGDWIREEGDVWVVTERTFQEAIHRYRPKKKMLVVDQQKIRREY